MFVNVSFSSAVLPLWTILFETELYGHPGTLAIPFTEMFIVFSIVLGSAFVGYLLRIKCPDFYDRYWTYLPVLAVLALLCIAGVEIYSNYAVFLNVGALQATLAALLAIPGFLLGAGVGYALRQTSERIVTLALETGVRTSYVTNLCATMTWPQVEAVQAKTAPVLCSLLSLLPTVVLVLVFRIRARTKLLREAVDNYGSYNVNVDGGCSSGVGGGAEEQQQPMMMKMTDQGEIIEEKEEVRV